MLAAVRHEFATPHAEIDTGTLRDDLLAQATALTARLGQHAGVLSGLPIAIRDNGELGRLVRAGIVDRDREIMTGVIDRRSPAANCADRSTRSSPACRCRCCSPGSCCWTSHWTSRT
ncbi:TetR-like C-terminal domain-containing protein [Kibdelosporangium phytohabitans]|uniref:Uncharacterized protein n=1 Tax=Kibdelosporangium phytohabitans TaxID=860235 RepID=A0A0N9HVG8_9PSEU|nr:TetR-like C-terminal domain-containing protein [Kibdelosporangium phytohabitans]ALG11331.1 hypothetical protein AOZ06_34640 [Kibdelosporangium phytohabitans]MBE1462640.1 hypothetical protein [Kibdelosporangium phytohabitans]